MDKPDFRRDWWKVGAKLEKLSFSRDSRENCSNFCPGRMEAPLHGLDPNSPSIYVKCPRKYQKVYNFDIFLHFPKFTSLPLLNFGMNPTFDHIPPMCILINLHMQSLMFLNCFGQKLSSKKIWGAGSTPPFGKGRVNKFQASRS